MSKPPAVADLLLEVRTEESRRREKKLRLKARNVRANVVTACESGMASQMKVLQDQVQQLTLQIQSLAAVNSVRVASPTQHPVAGHQASHQASNGRGRGNPRGRGAARGQSSKFGLCFRCGQDGHRQDICTVESNPELVQQRLLSGVQRPSQSSSNQEN